MKKTLGQVQSWYYYIHRESDLRQAMQDIRESSVDMVVLTLVNSEPLSMYDQGPQDPIHDKLILGYVNSVEAGADDYLMKQEFANGTPSWLGAPHAPWPELYSVRFWEPAWETVLHRYIDARIEAGVDGIFLDGGPWGWTPGNTLGNPAREDAVGDLYALLVHIREYVDQKHLDRPFYLMANGVHDVAAAHPQLFDVLDGVLLESLGWIFAPDDHLASVPYDVPVAATIAMIDNIYRENTTVFSVDYPPLTGLDDAFAVFRQAADVGWRPSVTHDAHQDGAALREGPRQAVATTDGAHVVGEPRLVNMLAGGRHTGVTLTGGAGSDYLQAGWGVSTLEGNGGDDQLFMHPAARYAAGVLELRLASTVTAGTAPHVVVRLNGVVVLADTAITATHGQTEQVFSFRVPPAGLHSLELTVSGCTFIDAGRFSHLDIEGISVSGSPVELQQSMFQNGGIFSYTGNRSAYSNDGAVTLGPEVLSQLPVTLGATATSATGGAGIDVAVYDTAVDGFEWHPAAGGWIVAAPGFEVLDALAGVERLRFDDAGIALDLDANAGLVVKLLGAVFGASVLDNPQYVGQGLSLADSGMAPAELAALALGLRLGGSYSFADELGLLFHNIAHRAPSPDEVDYYAALATESRMDAAQFALAASNLAVNLEQIGFAVLQGTGIAYSL